MDFFLPSEIARLVYGYLLSEGTEHAADVFIKTSPNLKECLQRKQNTGSFNTKINGCTLQNILDDYILLCNAYNERKNVGTNLVPLNKNIATSQTALLLNPTKNDLTNNVSDQNHSHVTNTLSKIYPNESKSPRLIVPKTKNINTFCVEEKGETDTTNLNENHQPCVIDNNMMRKCPLEQDIRHSKLNNVMKKSLELNLRDPRLHKDSLEYKLDDNVIRNCPLEHNLHASKLNVNAIKNNFLERNSLNLGVDDTIQKDAFEHNARDPRLKSRLLITDASSDINCDNEKNITSINKEIEPSLNDTVISNCILQDVPVSRISISKDNTDNVNCVNEKNITRVNKEKQTSLIDITQNYILQDTPVVQKSSPQTKITVGVCIKEKSNNPIIEKGDKIHVKHSDSILQEQKSCLNLNVPSVNDSVHKARSSHGENIGINENNNYLDSKCSNNKSDKLKEPTHTKTIEEELISKFGIDHVIRLTITDDVVTFRRMNGICSSDDDLPISKNMQYVKEASSASTNNTKKQSEKHLIKSNLENGNHKIISLNDHDYSSHHSDKRRDKSNSRDNFTREKRKRERSSESKHRYSYYENQDSVQKWLRSNY